MDSTPGHETKTIGVGSSTKHNALATIHALWHLRPTTSPIWQDVLHTLRIFHHFYSRPEAAPSDFVTFLGEFLSFLGAFPGEVPSYLAVATFALEKLG
jgi:hypothetical protein